MRTYERTVRLDAPLERVWVFHSTVDGLRQLTPGWLHPRVEAVGPNGERDPAVLAAGSRLRISVRPFGVGPRQPWVAEIVARERSSGSAFFRDVAREGPLEWRHDHCFYADGAETLLRDRVTYETPAAGLDPAAWPLLEAFFRYRHRRTREALS